MKFRISLLLLMGTMIAQSQNTAGHIDLNRIPQRKIRTLVNTQFNDNNIQYFKELRSTYKKGQDLKGYHILESVYYLKELPEKVWKIYQNTSPAESWNGSMISFGLLLSKSKNTVMYNNDKYYSGIDTGQVFYVNLRIMKGLYNLAVGLEIINIDSTQKSITFSYLKGGKSQGEQTIFFIPTKKGHTEIIHETAFKSGSFIRDRYLYPYFHKIAINEFHRNMKRCINENNKLLAQKISK
jgi:hypothetical protein